MPGLSVRHTDWLNENTHRAFPFADGSSRSIPHGLLVDLSIPVPVDVISPDSVFLHSLSGFGQGVALAFATTDAPDAILATITVYLTDHELNKSYPVIGSGRLSGSVGRANVGAVEAVQVAAALSLDFSTRPQEARVVPSAIRPALRGITGITVVDENGDQLGVVNGPVTLQAGLNMGLQVAGNRITFNSGLLDSGIDQEDDCGCGYNEEAPRPCIRSINGVLPDSQGNVQLVGTDNLEIVVDGGQMSIDDSTTTPCCECDQLDVLYSAIQAVEHETTQLQTVSEQMRARLDNVNAVISAAALNVPPSSA